jgi:hypothetical protein
MAEVLSGSLRQLRVQLNAHYSAARNRRRGNCRVVSGAATDMKEAIARRQVEIVEASQQKCGLAVVQIPRSVQCNEHVVVDVPWIVVWRELVAVPRLAQPQDLPRPGTEELLTRNACEGINQTGRPQRGQRGDLLRELATRSL